MSLRCHVAALTLVTCCGVSAQAAASPPRVLVIGIDAIPYSVAAALTEPGLGEQAIFRDLKGPSAVVSSFPSTSYPAWSSLLAPFGVEPSPGYIGKYYTEESHRVLGVAAAQHEDAPWLSYFDWHLDGLIAKAIAYGNARRSSSSELEKGLAAFAASDKPIFWMYILSTDALGHEQGPTALADFLREVDTALRKLHRAAPERPFYTVLVSDHGMAGGSALVNTWPAVRDAMQKAGFRDAHDLAHPGDAIFIPLGILTFFFVHTWPGQEARAAAVLAHVPGVDLCVYPDAGAWTVLDQQGRARIARRESGTQLQWSYDAQRGDPLGYLPVVKALRARAGDATASWFPDDWWFAQTYATRYPDALHRIAGAFEEVQHPASLLCSLEPGYMFSARAPELLARSVIGPVKWTHGALTSDATMGMLLSDVPAWMAPAAVRAGDALAFLEQYGQSARPLAAP